MIKFKKQVLANGLTVLVYETKSTHLAALNILYQVGARDENPEKTGFAHLFEHLMFGGSQNIPHYDKITQKIGAENNAFTSNDITNYYLTFPAYNLEAAFWLESDRMNQLAFSYQSLEVQRNVVIEEFKQRYLNQPYGDAWLKLRPMAYKLHPYQWPTIGKSLKHIEDATLADVEAFFYKHYRPNNAIICVAGNVVADEVFVLAEKWFGDIPPGAPLSRNYELETPQLEAKREEIMAAVPNKMLYKVYHMPGKKDAGYHAVDVVSDLLSRGKSSRLYRNLVMGNSMFSNLNAYITGEIDPGLFVINGQLSKNISFEEAEAAIEKEIQQLINTPPKAIELEKVKNQLASAFVFGEAQVLNIAMNLCMYEMLGDAADYNTELSKYQAVTAKDIQQVAANIFRPENASTLVYQPL